MFHSLTYAKSHFKAKLSSLPHIARLPLLHCLNEDFIMPSAQFRIESRNTLTGSLLPSPNFNHLYKDASLAVAIAVKSVADPTRQEVRVVHVPSGEIVFKTTATAQTF